MSEMPHALANILSIREDARSLTDAALMEAILKPVEATDATLMVKNLLAAEAIERGLDADDPVIDFPPVMLAGGEADHSVVGLLPEDMRERAMSGIVKGEALPLEIVVANHGFELRLRPESQSAQEKPSITYRIKRTMERVLSPESFEKRIERRDGQWCVIAETSGRNMGCYDSKEAAQERLDEIHRFSKAETYSPPNGVKNAAKRALGWISEGKQGDGFTMTGRARAGQLARGESVSLETVKRMHSFFSRHTPDKQATGFSMGEKGYPSPGRVAWDAWGGDAGARWAAGIVARVEKNGEEDEYETAMPVLNDRQKAMYVAYEKIAEMLGPWDASSGANGAHYMEEHPFVEQGMICGNCAFYEAPGGCEILNQSVNALGVCKLWVIPEALIGSEEAEDEEDEDEENGAREVEDQLAALLPAVKRNPYHDPKTGKFTSAPAGGAAGTTGAGGGSFNPDTIIDQLNSGEKASIDGDQVGPVFSRMAQREGHPDVTELHINGTMLLGDEGLGYARSEMPQIPPDRRGDFMTHLESSKGIGTKSERVDPRTLRPVQSEISGRTSGSIFESYKESGIPDNERIIVSRDNYVIDGHHTWGASVAVAFSGGSQTLPVYRIDSDARTVLREAHEYADSIGSGRLSIDAEPLKKSGALWYEWEVSKYNPYHDNLGRFTSAPVGSGRGLGIDSRPYQSQGPHGTSYGLDIKESYDGATGGYKAGIPTKISAKDSPVGEALDPSHSLWHHLEKNPDWDGTDSRGQYRVTEARSEFHAKLVREKVDPVDPVPAGEDKVFVFLGGGPASGKSTGLSSGVFTGVPPKGQYVEVNADDVKEKLPEFDQLRYSRSSGEYKAAASFVHEESSMIAKMQQRAAVNKGTHVVLDGTGDGSPAGLKGKIDAARSSGYVVRARYSTLETNEAWSRAEARSRGRSRRYVQEGVVRTTHRDVSRSWETAIEGGWFDDYELTYNGVPKGVPPILVINGGAGRPQTIVRPDLYDDFIAKGDE